MTKCLLFIICFCTISKQVFSQNEKMNWHFGNYAALDFNSGSPVLINSSSLETQEGCASVSDGSGNLLFYSDGLTVWDKNNNAMPNGTGLLGNPSTTQAALITPCPGNSAIYYVFAIDELGGAMTYSKVNMTLNGGLGDVVVTSKNILLHAAVAEKQAAIKRCDGNIWIISHDASGNTFYCDLITPSGINPSVISSVGLSQAGGTGAHYNTAGQLKISPLGNKLALAIRDVGVFELFDFDINTGIISNSQPLNMGSYPTAYGVEFSPDATKLYGSVILSGEIIQFDLTQGTTSAIANSATLIGTTGAYFGDLQVAPDGKIYAAQCYNQFPGGGINSLCVINSPNSLGSACGYVQSGLSLGTKSSSLGLPNFITTNTNLLQSSVSNDTTICSGQSVTLTAIGGDTYQWSGGSNATANSIIVNPNSTTDYIISISNSCDTNIDTITVNVETSLQITVSNDTTICSGQSITLTASGGNTYQWSGGSNANTSSINVTPNATTNYFVSSTNTCGSDKDTVTVNIINTPSITVSNDTTICSGQSVTLIANGSVSYQWSGGSSAITNSINVNPTNSTTYYVTGESNSCGSDTDTVNVNVEFPLQITISNDTTICLGQIAILTATGGSTYQWSGGSSATTNSIIVAPNDTTIYSVTAANTCNNQTDSLTVYVINCPGDSFADAENSPLNYHIPNVFTPNSDGQNDYFTLNLINAATLNLQIFNRWGNSMVTITDVKSKGWDGKTESGKIANEGIYFFLYQIKGNDGKKVSGQGFLQLVRN